MSYTFYVVDTLKTKNSSIIHVEDFRVINVFLDLRNIKTNMDFPTFLTKVHISSTWQAMVGFVMRQEDMVNMQSGSHSKGDQLDT